MRIAATWLAGILILVFCSIVIWGSWTRTFLVETRTFGTTLTLRGDTNHWELQNAALCKLRSLPDHSPLSESTYCPTLIFDVTELKSRILEWPSGSVVSVNLTPENNLQIEAISGTAPLLNRGDRIVVPSDTWKRHGALAVNGAITFGGDIGSGAKDYLISGHWQARQESLASSLFRPTMEIVKQGDLSRGASIEVWHNRWFWEGELGPDQATMFGHITPSFDADEPGMIIAAISEAARLELRLSYYGLQAAAVIRPDFLDTILTSPVLLAAAAIFGVLALFLELGSGLQSKSAAKIPKLIIPAKLRARPPRK